MKYLLSFFFIAAFISLGWSQPNMPEEKADSLWGVWEDKSLSDTSRLKAMQKISWDGYIYSKPDSAHYFAQIQLDFAKEKNEKKYVAAALSTQGASFYLRGSYTKALNQYAKSIKIRKEIGEEEGVASILQNMGSIYSNQGDYSKAIDHHAKSLKIRKEIGDKEGVASSLNSIGLIHRDEGNYNQAIDYFTQSLRISEQIGDKEGVAICFNSFALIYSYQGNYSKALNFYFQSLEIFKETGDKRGVISVLGNIGYIFKAQSDYTKAIDYYSKSLKMKKEFGDKEGIANLLNNIGVVYKEQGDYSKAVDYYSKSLKIRKEIGDKSGIATSINNIGTIYKELGDYSKAKDLSTKSLEIRKEIGDKRGIASSLNNIANIYSNQGDFTKATDYYITSLEVLEEIKDQLSIATCLNNIGIIYAKQKNYNKAFDYFSKSIKIREEIGDKAGVAGSLIKIGYINRSQGHYDKALKNLSRSLKISQKIGLSEETKTASRSLYITNILTNNLETSKVHLSRVYNLLNKAIETNFFTLPEKQKQIYFSTIEADYGLYHDFALNYQDQFDNVTDTAYNIALQNKGITLKSSTAMRQYIQESRDTSLINSYENWLFIKKKIANSSSQDTSYTTLTDQANNLERELVKQSNTFSDFDQLMKLKWQDVQAGLKENEAAIEFVNFQSEIDTANPIIYAALIVKKESKNPEMIKLCNEKDLKGILGVFQGNNLDFVNSVYGNKEKAQTQLYEKVWKPMEESLEGVEDIYLSPSGLLHKVAFHAIAKDQNTYLCDVYNLQQQSSTGKIALPDEVAFNKNTEFLMLGGVQYNTDTTANEIWSYLPGTLAETNNIKSYLQKKKFNITHLTGPNASEEKIKAQAPKSNILHVATHGFFFPNPEKVREEMEDNSVYYGDVAFRGNDIDPDKLQRSTRYANWTFVKNKNPLMRSGLALANANDVWQRPALAEGEDGVLTANEVSTLDLRNTDLVVLSACETGLGDIKGSEGVYGLQRAFKMAGAKYLIMSLWQVPDKETAEFMGLFYKHLVKLKDIRAAFSKTQKVMRKKYDPYYWAAFVLVK